MFSRMRNSQPGHFEGWISARSHAIWEREGRPDGKCAEHWARAEQEVEAAWQAAMEGEPTGLVPPRLEVSERPVRRAAARAEPEDATRTIAA